jgi:uncharacterized iron-regulated membrane protein
MYLLVAISFSIVMIVWLWHSDSKRRRVAALPPVDVGSDKRRVIAIAALLPGVVFAAFGDSASLLIWLGASVTGGWLISQLHH